eukprot:464285_1
MGQGCGRFEENERKIAELERLFNDQSIVKNDLRQQLIAERDAYKLYEHKHNVDKKSVSSRIEQLAHEKKQLFIHVVKEKKEVSVLEDTVIEYRSHINEMEQSIQQLKVQKEEATKKAKQAGKKPHAFTGLGSVMDGIKIPDFSNLRLSSKYDEPLPFKVKENRLKSRYGKAIFSVEEVDNDLGDDSSSSDEIDYEIERKDAILLESGHDAVSEATQMYSWLHTQKIDIKNKKELKRRLATLLTSRSDGYRQELIKAYRKQYNCNLENDIKKVIVKGHAMEIIHGLLMTRAQYDAILIEECVSNWDITSVADIICCRSKFQLQELHDAYKKKCKLDVKKQLKALATQDKKKTVVNIVGT